MKLIQNCRKKDRNIIYDVMQRNRY